MKDVVVGRGEIGYPIMEWLQSHKIYTETIDSDPLRSNFNEETKTNGMHICFPYSESFISDIYSYIICYEPRFVIIHSTVRPGTTKEIQEDFGIPIIYAPTMGIHGRMLSDFEFYHKWYACEIECPHGAMKIRWPKSKWVDSTEALERTKILCDTTYLGWLVAYRKMVDESGRVYWDFAEEIHERLGNRPVMYNDNTPIGGHCVIPNLDLLENNKYLNEIQKIISMFKK